MSYIGDKIDLWIEKINNIPSLNRYRLIWLDFDDLFTTLNDEVNKILENNVQEIATSQTDMGDHFNSCDTLKGILLIFI